MQKNILTLISQALDEIGLDHPQREIELMRPQNQTFGDFSTNIAMILYSTEKPEPYHSPRELAQALVEQMTILSKREEFGSINKIEVAGPGFINFYLTDDILSGQLLQILEQKEKYGKSSQGNGKLAIVEFSSPNIAKPFTIGHLRSTLIGDALANLKEYTGWKVLRDNHLGDWGTQFGKQIYAIKCLGEGEEKNIQKISQSTKPVKELVDLYVEFHRQAEEQPELNNKGRFWFKKLEDGDTEARNLWQLCIDWSWQEFNRIYEELGITFSSEFNQGRGLGESFFEDKMTTVIQQLKELQLLQAGKGGAQLVFFDESTHLPPLMILKADGATLYATRDLATDYYRLKHYAPNVIINEVGAEQSLYFKQIFKTEELLGWYKPGQRVHIGHGLYRFKDKKMSTRKGEVVWLEEVIDEAKKRARNLILEKSNLEDSAVNQLAKAIGIGALKWNDLKKKPSLNVSFDWQEILSMEGYSGPYVQYTHARAMSVLKKAGNTPPSSRLEIKQPEEKAVAQQLIRFPEVVNKAALEFAPYQVTQYLYELSQAYNTFYNQHSILGSTKKPVTPAEKTLRLTLTAATAQVLKNGLKLLGIEAPESM